MKEINIAQVLVNRRKEKGITQDELASYIGVSKASVSKWETGQSYPDVTFLPQLATYFNISIDELMDYKPQMKKEDIRQLYRRLSADFASKPADEVMEECHEIIKKYYSCFPLLLQIGSLMINHASLLKNQQESTALLEEARTLFIRVKEESNDVSLTKQALYLEALSHLALGDPHSVLALLEGKIEPALPPESLLVSAYQMTGRVDDAKAILQVGIYQNIVVLFNFFPAYLALCADTPGKFDEMLRRALVIVEAFDMKRLHPAVTVGLYLTAAQGYVAQGNHDKALEMLQQYTTLITSDIYPMHLHGDAFFDRLDGWLDDLDLGTNLPRDDKTIRQSLADAVVHNPAFSAYAEDKRFQRIVEKLQNNCI
ncbi:helix-turn-helix domain-containing protein [Desulfosporosinus sp.]|uniref:helix-turn-helix domain-containing protein n=1 Tax=Desulfosporosinus sp. TaxID=157907 RepID=UPI0025B82812|nr:helix-turn-helix domain-containing protein [Desulfosporosinus sp.]MBC2724451.1 helix-turn-helix domain-containing protein [Desulfosporosinus sp.]MBC2727578.1 helix-turn-helix domain-containing protein [Desulfosporosinus sp.]